jgi:hypothetical protein
MAKALAIAITTQKGVFNKANYIFGLRPKNGERQQRQYRIPDAVANALAGSTFRSFRRPFLPFAWFVLRRRC